MSMTIDYSTISSFSVTSYVFLRYSMGWRPTTLKALTRRLVTVSCFSLPRPNTLVSVPVLRSSIGFLYDGRRPEAGGVGVLLLLPQRSNPAEYPP